MISKIKIDKKYLAAILATVIVASISLIIFIALREHGAQGQFAQGEIYTGETLHQSLDLSVASKASYPSVAISEVQDIGKANGLNRQIISFEVSDDHLTEYGLMMLPSSPEPSNGYPVIILCHGYINPSQYVTTLGYLNDMQFYTSHGYVVIKPDYRGQGLSAQQGQAEGAYYSMAYNTDILSLVSAIKKTKYLDKNNISIWGHSLGAYVGLRAATISPDIKNLILLSGPVGDLEDMYLKYVAPSDVSNPIALRISQDVFQKYGTPAEGTKFWQEASPTNHLTKLKAKVQIHVGSEDEIVPPVFSAYLDQKLSANNKPHEYYIYKGAKHGLIPQRQAIWDRSLKLLQS